MRSGLNTLMRHGGRVAKNIFNPIPSANTEKYGKELWTMNEDKYRRARDSKAEKVQRRIQKASERALKLGIDPGNYTPRKSREERLADLRRKRVPESTHVSPAVDVLNRKKSIREALVKGVPKEVEKRGKRKGQVDTSIELVDTERGIKDTKNLIKGYEDEKGRELQKKYPNRIEYTPTLRV
jgi:hypothetical protein